MRRCMGCMAELEETDLICPFCRHAEGTPPREAYHLNPGTILGGRYIAGRVLGFGGFGVTYMGWDEQLQRKVAIKEFLPSSFATRMPGFTQVSVFGGEATEQFQAGLQRFVDEAMRLAKFNGIPGIVDIYDTFVENNTAYIVMEYLQGCDVKQKLEREGVFSYEAARDIILKVCETLGTVHKEGMIHRDLSPDNIFLTDGGEVKLLDFGASRYATSINSKSLSVILKAGYAPEEQYRSKGDQGSWSDVYALAATFYKMITGITPMDSMERAIGDELEEPSKLGVNLPKSSEYAILNAMNVRKENRTQTVEAFAHQLNSDGVERIREKIRKSDSGGLPLWGKVILGGGISLTLLFGLLTVTGVVNLGQGNLLEDSFGPAVEEGYVNAPGIVNLMEEEAQKQVKKAGLDYLITGKEYSDSIAKGKILTQTPLPGRVMALGELIEVMISGGSRKEAIEAGEMEIPDISFMEINEAMYTMNQQGFYYYTRYEFSDTVAEGLVIRYEPYESGGGAQIFVSGGRKGQQGEFGTLRAPFYDPGSGCILFCSTVEKTLESGVNHTIQYSLDGKTTWSSLKAPDGREFRNYTNYYVDERNRFIAEERIQIDEVIGISNPDLLGRELKLRIVRKTNSGDNLLDITEIPGSVMVETNPWDLQVTGGYELTWDRVRELKQREEIDQYHILSYALEDEVWQQRETPFQLNGNFKKNHYYQMIMNENDIGRSGINVKCSVDGVIYGILFDSTGEQMESYPSSWYLVERLGGEVQENQRAVMRIKTPLYLQMKNWEPWESGAGKPFLEGAFPSLGIARNEVLFEESGQAPGTLLREYFGWQNYYTVSCGSLTPQPENGKILTTLLLPDVYGEILAGCVYMNEKDGYYSENYQLIYSDDGGRNFQTLKDRDGNPLYVYYYDRSPENPLVRLGANLGVVLFQDKKDLWEKELVLGFQGKENRSVAQETLTITKDHDPVAVNGIQPLKIEDLETYEANGKLPKKGLLRDTYENFKNGHMSSVTLMVLEGNFRAGCNYYLLPGGNYNDQAYECLEDGVLLYGYWKVNEVTERNRTDYRNTVVQRLDYEYKKEKRQLVIHVSPGTLLDLEGTLSN